MTTLRHELEQMDWMRGCTPRSVQAAEAAWPQGSGVPWPTAYALAKERAGLEAEDQHGGRVVGFLEGLQAGLRMGGRDGV